jgi:hypothetical protein
MTNVVSLLRTPATVRYFSAGPPDEHNDPTDEWTDVAVLCNMQQRSRQEYEDSGDLSSTMWLVVFAPTIDLPLSTDQLVVNGDTFQFRGDSWLAYGTRGNVDHIEATLVRAE